MARRWASTPAKGSGSNNMRIYVRSSELIMGNDDAGVGEPAANGDDDGDESAD